MIAIFQIMLTTQGHWNVVAWTKSAPPLWLEQGCAKNCWGPVPTSPYVPAALLQKIFCTWWIIIGVIHKLLKIVWMEIAFHVSKVRMAERSKAPDSRVYSSLLWSEHSGPRMRAWVRIPLLTQTFCFSYKITEFSNAQASFRTLFMFSYFQCNVYLCNELSYFMNSLNDIWMNEFWTKSPSEMNGIQTKIKWFRNILKKICMYLFTKKICRITKTSIFKVYFVT